MVSRELLLQGINPHAGENGLFGNEEINEIIPAVRNMKEKGINVEGPFPPDTVFLQTLGVSMIWWLPCTMTRGIFH